MAEWTLTDTTDIRLEYQRLIKGTRYHGLVTNKRDYDRIFMVRLNSKLGQFVFEFLNTGILLTHIIEKLLAQREILFRKFEL